MPIQFNCPACGQPIEVDDVIAGRSASCPYCSKVVQAPSESTLTPPASARPIGSPPEGAARGPAYPPPPPRPTESGLHVGAPPPNLVAARLWGWRALLCSVGVLLLLGAVFFQVAIAMTDVVQQEYGGSPPTTITAEDSARIRRLAQEEMERRFNERPWMGFAYGLAVALAIAGLACGVRSLSHWRPGNWRGYGSVVVCGLLLTCTCGGLVFSLLQGA
jgi:drug/metabolite transporter (DMT)-like permease